MVFPSGPTHVLIASGPFTTSDSLSFEPLTDLISTVKEKQPDVTILVRQEFIYISCSIYGMSQKSLYTSMPLVTLNYLVVHRILL